MTELLEQPKLESTEPATIEKVAIVASKGSLEGIYPALIMANGARMEGIEADLFFTFFGLDAIRKDRYEHIKVATVGNPGMHLPTLIGALPGLSALATRMMKRQMEKIDIPPVPEFIELAADSGETVNIAVLSDRSALYLDQVAGQSALQSHNWVGQHIPLHATSNGKLLLSGLSADEIDKRLPRLPSYTADTVTSKARLRRDLAAVSEQGYAVAVDELEEGLTAVAAPIRNAHGDVIASMSVSGPTFRLPDARVEELVPLLAAAAEEVSHRLGWGHR